MDVMLRIGARLPAVEEQLAALGYEIIIPRARTRIGRTDMFQVSLANEADFGKSMDRARSSLARVAPVLANLPLGGQMEWIGEVNFGVEADQLPTWYVDYLFPPGFMAILASLKLALNITVYASTNVQHQPS